jgi:dUTPase
MATLTIPHRNDTYYYIKLQILGDNIKLYEEAINKGNPENDSGFALYVPEPVIIPPGEIKLINMGVKCAVYKKDWNKTYQIKTTIVTSPYYLYARPNISKLGIILANSSGIDSSYRGPLVVAFYNTGKKPCEIATGDSIVQICMPELSYNFTVNCVDDLDKMGNK